MRRVGRAVVLALLAVAGCYVLWRYRHAQSKSTPNIAALELIGEGALIAQRIMSALGHEPLFSHAPKLNINVEGQGIVYLRGPVSSAAHRARAERIAYATPGVTRVVNLLEISPEV